MHFKCLQDGGHLCLGLNLLNVYRYIWLTRITGHLMVNKTASFQKEAMRTQVAL